MTRSFLGKWCVSLIVLITVGVLGGCGHGEEGLVAKELRVGTGIHDIGGLLFEAKASERDSPDDAIRMYKELIAASQVEHTFDFYRLQLQQAVEELQRNPLTAQLSDEAVLGYHGKYASRVNNWVKGWQGLARVHERKQNLNEARSSLVQALTISRQFVMIVDPPRATRLMNETYESLAEVEAKAGRTGKALVANLSAHLLAEYVLSDAYRDDEEVSHELNEADYKIMGLISKVDRYRIEKDYARMEAVIGAVTTGLLQANAVWSQMQATNTLAKSGGVMTPQAQMAQMNAQLAQFQVQVFSSIVKMETGQNKGIDLMASPLALPTFGRQLVDPQMGTNSRRMVKTFAAEAATVGATPTLQQGAQQLIREVDGLPTFQTNSNAQVLTQRVGQFAEVFNTFVNLVAEVKAPK